MGLYKISYRHMIDHWDMNPPKELAGLPQPLDASAVINCDLIDDRSAVKNCMEMLMEGVQRDRRYLDDAMTALLSPFKKYVLGGKKYEIGSGSTTDALVKALAEPIEFRWSKPSLLAAEILMKQRQALAVLFYHAQSGPYTGSHIGDNLWTMAEILQPGSGEFERARQRRVISRAIDKIVTKDLAEARQ